MIYSLDEAIKYHEEVAEEQEKKARKKNDGTMSTRIKCEECAKEHRQLADWLKELKAYKDKDMRLIYANPLAEAIRCAMCTNPIKSDRGCDGGCKVDEQMYKKVMEAVNGLIVEVKADEDTDNSMDQ